jgi:hypothetical protein
LFVTTRHERVPTIVGFPTFFSNLGQDFFVISYFFKLNCSCLNNTRCLPKSSAVLSHYRLLEAAKLNDCSGESGLGCAGKQIFFITQILAMTEFRTTFGLKYSLVAITGEIFCPSPLCRVVHLGRRSTSIVEYNQDLRASWSRCHYTETDVELMTAVEVASRRHCPPLLIMSPF